MDIKLETHKSTNIATKAEVTFPQYKVMVDGTCVAYKSWKPNTKVCFIGRVSPLDRKEIERVVGLLLQEDSTRSVEPPEYNREDHEFDLEQALDDLNEEDVA